MLLKVYGRVMMLQRSYSKSELLQNKHVVSPLVKTNILQHAQKKAQTEKIKKVVV